MFLIDIFSTTRRPSIGRPSFRISFLINLAKFCFLALRLLPSLTANFKLNSVIDILIFPSQHEVKHTKQIGFQLKRIWNKRNGYSIFETRKRYGFFRLQIS